MSLLYQHTWVVGLEVLVHHVAVEHGRDGGLLPERLVLLPLEDVAFVVGEHLRFRLLCLRRPLPARHARRRLLIT